MTPHHLDSSPGSAPPTEGSRPSSIGVSDLIKRFGEVTAIGGVTLDFPTGQVTALMGENGAGKSTLLKILTGDHQPTEGHVVVNGESVDLGSPARARAAGIRIIPQEPEIVPHISVAENVYAGALPRKRGRVLDRAELNRRIRADLDRLGFAHVLDPDLLGSQLTPAQRQLVEIMRALTGTTTARLIAFDEPTSSLSEHEVDALFALIRRLRDEDIAIVYVSHRMQEIFQLADRIAVLRDGSLAGVQDARATDEEELVRLMVGRDLSAMFVRQRVATGRLALDVQNLTTDDVTDISLRVHAGEVVGLAGLIGAGRSELALALAGDLPVHSGTATLDGVRLRSGRPGDVIGPDSGSRPRNARTRRCSSSSPSRTTPPSSYWTGCGAFVSCGGRRNSRLAQEFSDRLRVRTPSIDHEVRKLSGGNQQKVVLARWLARKPKVLILDEPTRGIDVGAKAEIYQIIADLAAEGVAVLVISSELPELLGLADRVVVMQGGRITGELDRSEATEESILALAMADDIVGAAPGAVS